MDRRWCEGRVDRVRKPQDRTSVADEDNPGEAGLRPMNLVLEVPSWVCLWVTEGTGGRVCRARRTEGARGLHS